MTKRETELYLNLFFQKEAGFGKIYALVIVLEEPDGAFTVQDREFNEDDGIKLIETAEYGRHEVKFNLSNRISVSPEKAPTLWFGVDVKLISIYGINFLHGGVGLFDPWSERNPLNNLDAGVRYTEKLSSRVGPSSIGLYSSTGTPVD